MSDVAQILSGTLSSQQQVVVGASTASGVPVGTAGTAASESALSGVSSDAGAGAGAGALMSTTTNSTTSAITNNNNNNNNNAANTTIAPPPPPPISHHPSRSMKMSGMSREVMELMSGKQDTASAALPPIVPSLSGNTISSASMGGGNQGTTTAATVTGGGDAGGTGTTTTAATMKPVEDTTIKIGNRFISSNKPARSWVWAPFASSARTDGAMFKHWVRAGVEYPDYPYARFDIHLDPITYTQEEYFKFLKSDSWTKSETDLLMELARKFELRWVIIHDRWTETFSYENTSNNDNDGGSDGAGDTKALSSNNNNNNNNNNSGGGQRKIEDLQYRYYHVAAILAQSRVAQEAASEVKELVSKAPPTVDTDENKALAEKIVLEQAAARAIATTDPQNQPLIPVVGTGTTNKDVFDLQKERERRAHMELVWNRTKEEEAEEAELRKELRLVEAQIRKLKKSGGHILAAATAAGVGGTGAGGGGGIAGASGPPSRNVSRSVTPIPTSGAGGVGAGAGTGTGGAGIPAGAVMVSDSRLLDQCFASTAPTPMPQTPYLQSGRLVPPATGGQVGLNKTTLKRMDEVLEQLKIPQRPIPTKRVCDLYDTVRKDVLTLLTLQKMVLQKEGQLQSKRLRLSKLGGGTGAMSEEMLLGVAPAPPPAPAPSSSGGGTGGSRSKSGSGSSKSKSKSGGKSKSKSSSSGGKESGTTGGGGGDGTTSTTTTTKKKKIVKRKKKSSKDKDGSKKSDGGKSPTTAGAATSGQTTASSDPKGTSATTTNTDDKQPSKKRAKKS